MFNTLLFMGNEVVSWLLTNTPFTGFIFLAGWLAWLVRGATVRFDKEVMLINHRIEKVEVRVTKLEDRVEKLEVRMTEVETRLAVVEVKIDLLSEKVDKLSDKFDLLLDELRNNRK